MTYTPSLTVIKNAAVRAAADPLTWIPLAGAGALYVSGVDDNWSERLADDQPLFGHDAEDASRDLLNVSYAALLVTTLATPTSGGTRDWITTIPDRLQVGIATLAIEGLASTGIKSWAGRERPNGEGDTSFPSGHAGQAAAAATLAAQNLEQFTAPKLARRAAAIGLYGVAGATGWARVEARKHFLSDSLVGLAFGHYLAQFMEEAFVGAGVSGVVVAAVPVEDGVALRFDMALKRGSPHHPR